MHQVRGTLLWRTMKPWSKSGRCAIAETPGIQLETVQQAPHWQATLHPNRHGQAAAAGQVARGPPPASGIRQEFCPEESVPPKPRWAILPHSQSLDRRTVAPGAPGAVVGGQAGQATGSVGRAPVAASGVMSESPLSNSAT